MTNELSLDTLDQVSGGGGYTLGERAERAYLWSQVWAFKLTPGQADAQWVRYVDAEAAGSLRKPPNPNSPVRIL